MTQDQPLKGVSLEISADDLSVLPMIELCAIRETAHLLAEIASSKSQARVYETEGSTSIIDKLTNALDSLSEAIYAVAMATKPSSEDEAEARAWLVLQRNAELRDDLPAFVTLAARAAEEARLKNARCMNVTNEP